MNTQRISSLLVITFFAIILTTGCKGSAGPDNSNPDARLQMVDLVNQARTFMSLNPLTLNLDLSYVAEKYAKDMVARNFLGHVDPDGHDFIWRVTNAGMSYTALGENVAAGYYNMPDVYDAFINSTPHQENILKPEYTEIGVGYAWGTASNAYGQSLYVCVLFRRP